MNEAPGTSLAFCRDGVKRGERHKQYSTFECANTLARISDRLRRWLKRVVSHTTGTAARQGAEAPIPPHTYKNKGGTLESPSRVRAGTAKGRSPQQTCVGWNRRRVEALGNAPPLRPCETPELMKRKQAAYRRSQHGALRSRSPITIRLTLV